MTKFSTRAESIESSATGRIKDIALRMKAQGKEVIDMSAGDPDFSSSEHVNSAAKDALDQGDTHYTALKGKDELRKAVAEKLRNENDLKTGAQNIIITPGAKQAIFETVFALIEDGDEVVILTPSWGSYESIVKMAGGTPITIPLDYEREFRLDSERLSEAVSEKTKLLLLNSPSNPTGTVFSKEELAKIRDIAVTHDFWVLSDEIYEKLTYDVEHHSIGAFDGMADRTITVNGFSKAHAMTGWRLGYYAAPEELVEQASKIHSHTVSCATSFSQAGGITALRANEGFVKEVRETFASRRDILIQALEDEGIGSVNPQGGFYAFVPVEDDDVAFAERLLEEQNVATTPGSAFGGTGYIRLAYTTNENQLREGIQRIGQQIVESR